MKYLLINFMVLVALTINAQSIDRSVIGNAGNTTNTGGVTLSFTVGEPVVKTSSSGSFVLTQGYQQSDNMLSSVNDEVINVNYHIYPNPTSGLVNLKLETLSSSIQGSVDVYSVEGKLVSSSSINFFESGLVSLDLSNEKAGVYFVRILDVSSKTSETIQLIKE